ncbi:MAG: 6-phosphofructokinase [Lachnospirales bacterium]
MKNLLVAQSGGPSSVINSSLAGLVIDALKSEKVDKVYGAFHGVEGIFKENFLLFNDVPMDEIRYMKTTPSSALGSCRYKLKDYDVNKDEYDKIMEVFKKYDIGLFFYIGGNDSMDTVNKLSKLVVEKGLDVTVVGIPKTIDNDLNVIDHTPGFGSCAKYINWSIAEMYRDAICYDKKQITLVEVMGRNAGWLAASACVATEYSGAPDLIYLPEINFDMDKFKSDIDKVFAKSKKCFIVISEGIHYADGKYVGESEAQAHDGFGHAKLGGTATLLKAKLEEIHPDAKIQAIELSILQRSAQHCASLIDTEEAFDLGRKGLQYALDGKTGMMSCLIRKSSLPYEIEYTCVPVSEVANFEKVVPPEYINAEENGITRAGFEYFLPLIQGQVEVNKLDGMPRHTKIKPGYNPKA